MKAPRSRRPDTSRDAATDSDARRRDVARAGDDAQARLANSPRMVAQRQRLQALRGGGGDEDDDEGRAAPNLTGLPDALKAGIESLSGMSLDHVRVHRSSPRPAQLQAHAYTQGHDIHLAPGQERHLPHEAWHVVQQARGRVRPDTEVNGVPVNIDHALEHEADVMGSRALGYVPDAGGTVQRKPADIPIGTSVAQRVVSINNQVLIGANLDVWLVVLNDAARQQALRVMADDRQNTYAFVSDAQLLGHLHGFPNNAPVQTAIPQTQLEDARRWRNRLRFHRKTVREDTLATHDAFDKIPREQLYRLDPGHYWRRNERLDRYERFRIKTQPAIPNEELLEYLDPKDKDRMNYGYLQGSRVITTRTDPRSSAGYSRSGAAGKTLYDDARGGFRSRRTYAGVGSVNPFKNSRTGVTFTIGHSQAVKNMSTAKDKHGFNSDQQPRIMVPENRTVGEQMKNPALEPETTPYVWNNFYDATPDTTYSGNPIPTFTEATLFKPDNSLDVNVRLRNDGQVDYRKAREAYAAKVGKPKVSYGEYMRAETTAPYAEPTFYASDDEDNIPATEEVPQTPAYFPQYLEEDEMQTAVDTAYGSNVPHKGSEWTVSERTAKDAAKGDTYSLFRTRESRADEQTLRALQASITGMPSTPSTQVSSTITTTPVHGVPPPKHPIPKLKISVDGLVRHLDQLIVTLPHAGPTAADHVTLQNFRAYALSLDLTNVHTGGEIGRLYDLLGDWFHYLEPSLRRNLTGVGGNVMAATGQRLAALEQYLSECGQMAVHNAIALEISEAEATPFQNLNQHIGDEAALRAHGDFEQNIDEDRIREMVVAAGRQGIPVISYINQLRGFVQRYNAANHLQQFFSVPITAQVMQAFGVQGAQLQEIAAMSAFLSGTRQTLNMIVNTDAHQLLAHGYHWITVRLERDHTGAIRIFYLDSLQGAAADYSHLFNALRQFIAHG